MAAAVSSIERRETSIVGQPRSAKSRRDAAISSATAIRSTYSVCESAFSDSRRFLANLHDSFRRCDKTHDQRMTQMRQSARQGNVGHERHICGLVATVRQIDAGWRFGCAADADQNDIRVLQVLRQLAVVAHHAEVERVDALEIVGVEQVLRAGARRRILSKVRFEQGQDWSKDRKGWRARRLAAFLEPP